MCNNRLQTGFGLWVNLLTPALKYNTNHPLSSTQYPTKVNMGLFFSCEQNLPFQGDNG